MLSIYIRNWTLSVLASSISFVLNAQVKDTLFLYNQSVLIGELKNITLGKLTIDADDVGLVNIKTTKIRTLRAASHYYRIETTHKKVYYSRILEDTMPGYIRIANQDTILSIALEDIANLSSFKNPKAAQWDGSASVGYSFTRSSKIGRLNGDFSLKRTTRRLELSSSYSTIITQTDTGWTRDNATGTLTGSYFINTRWQAVAFLQYQRNLELGLARRYQEGLGFTYSIISTNHVRLRTGSGIVLNQELNTEGVTSPTQVEIPFVNTFNFFSFSKPEMDLSSTQNVYFSLSTKGRVRHDGQIKLTWKVITDFSVTLTLYDNYDSKPPGINAATLDYGIVFGLSYSFTR
ncbi:DUF481 domain-containing protein [Paraflavitalea pollutisoli]|uniref:DUF481 domain-containing protein n=1 Tax=Paraflavitalea pollutisoli TaxID=3034143 RepID=UPI0023ED95A5|nr:DUF481 domain-containing protein [Paraflavitalea sp. H1-2-19X]